MLIKRTWGHALIKKYLKVVKFSVYTAPVLVLKFYFIYTMCVYIYIYIYIYIYKLSLFAHNSID